jgi:hypothetical protein
MKIQALAITLIHPTKDVCEISSIIQKLNRINLSQPMSITNFLILGIDFGKIYKKSLYAIAMENWLL